MPRTPHELCSRVLSLSTCKELQCKELEPETLPLAGSLRGRLAQPLDSAHSRASASPPALNEGHGLVSTVIRRTRCYFWAFGSRDV